MTNLKEQFSELKKNIIKTSMINEEKEKLKALKDRTIFQNLNLLNKNLISSFDEKSDIYKDFFYVTKSFTNYPMGYTECEILFSQMNSELKVCVKTELDYENKDIKVYIKRTPQCGNIFYFVNDNNEFKYAKVDYAKTVLRTNLSSISCINNQLTTNLPLKHIRKDSITWLSSIEELTDNLLNDILNIIKKDGLANGWLT